MKRNTVRNLNFRKSFARSRTIIDLPYLIELQKESYRKFLQEDVPPENRENVGLQGVFNSIFPIEDYNKTASLEFVSYSIGKPEYPIDECKKRGMTYEAPVKINVRLVIYNIDPNTGNRSVRNMKEEPVFFGKIPLMTPKGTFIVNGTERVIVNQLHRSPGVSFESDKSKAETGNMVIYSARLIPYRGSWLDFEFDHKDYIYVRIDRKRKIPATVILRALGFTTKQILDYYYKKEKIFLLGNGKYAKSLEYDIIADQRADRDIKNPKTGEIIVKKNMKFTPSVINKLKNAGVTSLPIELKDIEGKVVADDVVDESTGEVLLQTNEELTASKVQELEKKGIKEISVLFIDNLNVGPYIRKTLLADKLNSTEEALIELHRKLRPGEPATVEAASDVFYRLFFDLQKYDLSKVGRLKLNYKFNQDEPLDNTVLTRRDILETVRYLVDIRDGKGKVDDIDHLGNRRIRPVGELVENQYRIGLVRMERIVKEKMGQQEIDTMMPSDLVNSKPVVGVIKEFFGSSQLSQFMDQTNPLSELAHKRRLSALGPGGLTRERAGFEVRDVHPTHYGRICPVETPEGPNIGLIASLATYAKVNEFGFVETPYRKVVDQRATNEVIYLNALDEEKHIIAQATVQLDKNGKIVEDIVSARRQGEFALVKPEEVSLMDVSTNQMVSIAAGLIPFLEHDDANRALMGSNMQRQAVPLLVSESPLVGTGIEKRTAVDSGAIVVARRAGVVTSVDSMRIVVKVDKVGLNESPVDIYNLMKWHKTNQNNCFNQRPIVRVGDYVEVGDVLADGPTTDLGELSLGRNLLVAFIPWSGYNFEDAIILSERLVKEDVLTSIHIEEFECVARDTKLGKEEITRDIPGMSEEALKDLDESGVVRIGAEVKHGDILVGKITPKADQQLSPEEKLLRAIFGEKAGDVRDTSLRVPPGVQGVVIDAQVYTREAIDKDERARSIRLAEEARLTKEMNDQIKIINDSIYARLRKLLKDHEAKNRVQDPSGKTVITRGKKLTAEVLEEIPDDLLEYIEVTDPKVQQQLQQVIDSRNEQIDILKMYYKERMSKLNKSDELPTGVIKMVKVYVATKRKIQVGDKMAGRHGNKGVISKILREEDLPYLPDGTPVDIILNPLGVPSRMNVGQILETHLGWAAKGLGYKIGEIIKKVADPDRLRKELKSIYEDETISEAIDNLSDDAILELCRRLSKTGFHFATPVFDGAREEDIKKYLEKAGLPISGQTILFDGRTGEPFDQPVTVGYMYMLKLHHLVDDKIHARSTGPYSLVTQQPLGGKAQFGGQRLGEMEVWALEAYGAAYSLQEMLTVKSDDVVGRERMYESIVKGENTLECGLPESFNVLIKELQSLALDVQLLEEEAEDY